MTIPRVLLAACLLVLGFMVWGIHKDAFALKTEIVGMRGDFVKGVNTVAERLSAIGTPATPVPVQKVLRKKKCCPKAIVHKPTRPPIRWISPTEGNAVDGALTFRQP
jgi:hypothetical protein